MTALTLASASPRRRELLGRLTGDFEARVADIDERRRPDESAEAYTARLAREKATTVHHHPDTAGPTGVTLGADTVVVVDNDVLGKPADADRARAMLRRLSGRRHRVLTALALVGADTPHELCCTSDVHMGRLTAEEVDWYLASGEWLDKAGGYALQGLGDALVERVEGSVSNVIGLPLRPTALLLRAVGVPLRGDGPP